MTQQYIWQNGQFKPFLEAKTHVLSHALHYGSGIFEGIRAYELKTCNTAVLALNDHVERMYTSANSLAIKIPYSKEELCQAIIQTITINKLKSCYIRPLVYYGLSPDKIRINPDPNTPIEVVIYAYELGDYLPDVALDVLISKYIRIHPQSTTVEAKICGHYVNSLQGLLEIRGTKYNELIMLDHEGYVAEGSSDNIFVIKNNIIYTPKLGTILNGVTRKIIIDLATNLGYNVVENKILPQDLFAADEVFFTGTAVEVRAAGTINDQQIGNGIPGPITNHLKSEYLKVCLGENNKYAHYLTNISKQ